MLGLAALRRRIFQDKAKLTNYQAHLETSWLPLTEKFHGKPPFL
jgi:hypothetical protein